MRRLIPTVRTETRGPILQVVKTFIAASAAWTLCNLVLGEPLPIFAAITALLVVQPSVNQSLVKGVERSFGVILGVLLAYLAGVAFGPATWVVLLVVLASLLLAWALRLTPGSSNQIPISALLVIALGGGDVAYAAERIVETILGAVVGLIVNVLIVPPVLDRPVRVAIERLGTELGATLDGLARALRTPQDPRVLDELLLRARGTRARQLEAADAVDAAEESLTFNPRGARLRAALAHDASVLADLGVLVTRVIGMARAVRDHYTPDLPDDPIVRSIAIELSRAGHDVRLLARNRHPDAQAAATGDAITAELPALTAPLRITTPHRDHWILVGSLMEDLRRVREVLIGEST